MGRAFIVLFAGGINEMYNFKRYRNDLSLALEALSSLSNFSLTTTEILLGSGGDVFESLSSSVEAKSGSREALESAIARCAAEGTADDVFWLIASNHGGQIVKNSRNAKLYCWNEESVSDSELALWCSSLPMTYQIFVFGQCYSGGFIDNLESSSRVVIAASRWDQVSYAKSDLQHDEFLFHFLTAIRDGAATLRSAYDSASAKDERDEEPQLSDIGEIASRDDPLCRS